MFGSQGPGFSKVLIIGSPSQVPLAVCENWAALALPQFPAP